MKFYFFLSLARSWWQPSNASRWWFRPDCHHWSKWNRPSAPEVSECKWNTDIGFPAQPEKCMLDFVHRVLWATSLCWNKKSTWIHTGTGNKNTTKFAKYVFSCSYLYPINSFLFLYYSHKFTWLSALISWTHSQTRIEDRDASFLRYIRITPSTFTCTGSSFFHSSFPLSQSYLQALHLFIICGAEGRLASAVLQLTFSLQLSFKPNRLYHLSKEFFFPPLCWSGLTYFKQAGYWLVCLVHTWLFVSFSVE